ncbi:uncharacterized protein LOC133850340 [Drosophila sulfurigaster albostrigata]|uniref:uncharacterized protein LOC133850340 n=1 Tax=Drosophila sulfurigaster albostrigata TaxID=89887 RepID=UPI002D21BF9A|nr:uncharacterized protein LOC133850340 [Drosophila sulfurigaster albostrigata]
MSQSEPEIYGIPPDVTIRHELRIYFLSVLFAFIALFQWFLIQYLLDWSKYRLSPVRYGYWLIATFFGISVLSCTAFGRKYPCNVFLVAIIVESSTLYIAMEQQNTKGILVNVYAGLIVICLVVTSIIYGAYVPMRLMPGDLMLSVLVALGNIMLAIFFLNAYVFGSSLIYSIVRNFFAFVAVTMIMYTATIIHDRQFYVPKDEYIFLSVLLFFGHMILHERVLTLSLKETKTVDCDAFI